MKIPTTKRTTRGKGKRLTVHALSVELGLDPRTVRKRLVDAGLFPPEEHRREKVLDAIRPKAGDKSSAAIKERKTFEEWRRLKITNDAAESLLIERAVVAETIRKLAGKMAALLDSKLEQEYPAIVAGLDVPAARIYGKKLNDQLRAEVQSWAGAWK